MTFSCRLVLTCLVAAAVLAPATLRAAGRGEPGPVHATRVELRDRAADLALFSTMDLDVDGVFDGWARVYLLDEEIEKLRRNGYTVTLLRPEPDLGSIGVAGPRVPGRIPTSYHTYETLTTELAGIAAARPDLTRLYTIGESVQGRELWIMKITDNPGVEEDEPEVAYVAAMHGDEVVGKELCIELIHYLLDNYGTDSRITDLVDGSEIWILPSMNPDGTAAVQRYNAHNVDLNRDFPDWFQDPVNTPVGREPETAAIMAWVQARSITLSANFHGGTLVANYPFDNNPDEDSVYSPTPDPDDPAFYALALTYAEHNPPMYASPTFTNGVTNGAAWYAVTGGLQDWSYTWYGKFDLTLEISNVKWPAASQLPTFWNENRESMLSYIERAQEGLRGLVTDAATGEPVAAEIRLDADPFAVYTDPDVGDYHRIVMPGSYTLAVTAAGYYPQTIAVEVGAGPAARYDVALLSLPADLQPVSGRVEDGPAGNGLLDPGETTGLAVTLKNLGRPATAVSGRLVPTGWFADVLQDTSGYPDIGILETAESDADYQIAIDPVVPAGHKVGFAVEWTAAQGSGQSEPFFLDIGGACSVTPATDVPRPIADFQTVTSQLIGGPGIVDDVRVTVNITHTYIGDLHVKLVAPSGTEVVLHNRTGGAAHNIVGTYGVDLTPANPLSAFVGQPSSGTWRLVVADQAGGDVGTLNSWSLETCTVPVEASTPEMRLRKLGYGVDGVTLTWWPYPGMLSYRVYRATVLPTSAAVFADVTAQDADATDTTFIDGGPDPLVYYLVTGVGPQGEGPLGHYGQ